MFLVKSETLRVINIMYSTLDSHGKGNVRWFDFVRALTDAGFLATEGAGSSVRFKLAGEGCIDFHKPNPEPVIEPMALRFYARRLRKRFG